MDWSQTHVWVGLSAQCSLAKVEETCVKGGTRPISLMIAPPWPDDFGLILPSMVHLCILPSEAPAKMCLVTQMAGQQGGERIFEGA